MVAVGGIYSDRSANIADVGEGGLRVIQGLSAILATLSFGNSFGVNFNKVSQMAMIGRFAKFALYDFSKDVRNACKGKEDDDRPSNGAEAVRNGIGPICNGLTLLNFLHEFKIGGFDLGAHASFTNQFFLMTWITAASTHAIAATKSAATNYSGKSRDQAINAGIGVAWALAAIYLKPGNIQNLVAVGSGAFAIYCGIRYWK